MKRLIQKLETLCVEKTQIIAIDGPCGGGKTTLAAALRDHFDCVVVHMDDFFLRPEQRLPQRLATPGENIDHERFLTEVLLPLTEGKTVCYRPFDCHRLALAAPKIIDPAKLIIIEGSYSMHPNLRPHYDFTIFLDIDPEEQIKRIVKRNRFTYEDFRTRWIPLEQKYFAAFSVKENCDLVITQKDLRLYE